MYGYNAEPPIAIPIYTVLPYCVIGQAGASPSRTAGAARHIYTSYVSIRSKHSAVKPAITDSGAQHPQSACAAPRPRTRKRCVGCDSRFKTDQYIK